MDNATFVRMKDKMKNESKRNIERTLDYYMNRYNKVRHYSSAAANQYICIADFAAKLLMDRFYYYETEEEYE